MSSYNRRHFLKSTSAGVAVSSMPLIITDNAKGSPNERVRHAVIGTGGQGGNHCGVFSGLKDRCEVVAVCDVDPKRRAKEAGDLPNSSKVKPYEDYRRILDDRSIDTVSIATPDHWHAKIAIEAVLAGKHVYVEKPCCHNIREGQRLVEAAAKYKKCVQHGTQIRSGEKVQEAVRFMREGKLGKIRMAKAINHQRRGPIGRAPNGTPPNGVNYDLWLGPAPVHAFTKNRWHYKWHWFWDYGCGDIGNDGIHQVDLARLGLGVDLPKTVSGSGGQLFYDDDHETPDTQTVIYEYGDIHLVYEMRLWTDYKMEGHDNGVIFYGDKGKLEIGRKGCFVTFIDEEPKRIGGNGSVEDNARNFLDSVKADDPSKLLVPVTEGFKSATLCHLGNILTRTGRKLHLNTKTMTISGDPEADRLLGRTYRKGYELAEI